MSSYGLQSYFISCGQNDSPLSKGAASPLEARSEKTSALGAWPKDPLQFKGVSSQLEACSEKPPAAGAWPKEAPSYILISKAWSEDPPLCSDESLLPSKKGGL